MKSPQGLNIDFDDMGIAAALDRYQLLVPPNQRPYAWEGPHVQRLLEDLSAAITQDNPVYFLGTIVLTHSTSNRLEVADGQQRLATISILIGAIRDYLCTLGQGEKTAAEKYTSAYLLDYDEMAGESIPKLLLNTDDNNFFLTNILLRPDDVNRRSDEPQVGSNRRLYDAAEIVRNHVQKIVAQHSRAEGARRLYQWIKFLIEDVIVIVITVPDHLDAFLMFETLNDRGLRASQTDILKNYLFGRAQDRRPEVEPRWSSMVGIIESVGEDELLVSYLRHFWITKNGPTTERELASKFKDGITGKQQAVDIAIELESNSNEYAALLAPLDHPRWNEFDRQTRGYISVITSVLGIEQIRPLLLAIVRNFERDEVKISAKMLVAWSVRFLIAGGGGGGVLDRHYGLRAQEITAKQIKTAKALSEKMSGIVPLDPQFKERFRTTMISKTILARYYLRALELFLQNDDAPMLGGVDDTLIFNLEHVMPLSLSEEWNIEPQWAQAYYKRLGNMVLLRSQANVRLGNKAFLEKRIVYAQSTSKLTQSVGSSDDWGPVEIDKHQGRLADIAPSVWPLL
jgi:hypothetical protein